MWQLTHSNGICTFEGLQSILDEEYRTDTPTSEKGPGLVGLGHV
ncbi:hypothetical protein [Sporisorium scitamineum]|uniref:Uncharacterized protein n=1 Tax=Sporisorium scitamineum TaxID=49012 RepID=A0A0F7RYG3_9BASI|nr:hypothetical protein [Sporisorium scitamineum]